jgi:hypothetical protein
MGVKYVMIDTKHQRHHTVEKGGSTIKVDLNHHIENAISVEVSSFSTANELFNVKADNNKFTMMIYNMSGTPNFKINTYTVQPGLYTITELIDVVNAEIDGAPMGTVSAPVSVEFLLLGNNKVQLNTSSASGQFRRLVLYSNSTDFHNSIYHRLGFNIQQVFQSTNIEAKADYDDTIPSPNQNFTLFKNEGGGIQVSKGLYGYVFEVSFIADRSNPLIWQTNLSQSHTSNNIGHETYQNLLLKSDLVSGDFQKVYLDNVGVTHTFQENILEKIDMTVSSFNYIHFEKHNPMVHQLSGKIIKNFTISLCDDNGKTFDTHESKTFTCILKFITADDGYNKVNENNVLRNQSLGFLSRHNCG